MAGLISRGIGAALAILTTGIAAPTYAATTDAASGTGLTGFQSLGTQRVGAASKLDATLSLAAAAAKTVSAEPVVASKVEALVKAAPGARATVTVPSAMPEVLADIVVDGDADAVAAQLKPLGVTRFSQFSNLISAWIPADRLADAAAIGAVHSMRAPRARTHVGAVTSQGDYVQRSQFLRASTLVPNLSGAGVKVGVLSDSFGCTSAITSYNQDVGTGDLPADVAVLQEISDCTQGEDEGRAMSQIVYDVAPGSKLLFASAFNGEASFASNIVSLAKAGAQVIVDDVGYFDEPFYQDGIVSQAVDQVRSMGVAYYSSAGNSARSSYESTFRDSGVVGPAGGVIDGERLLNWDTSGATNSATLPITIGANASVLIYFQWDDPYKTGGGPGGGAKSLLDMCLTDGPAGGVVDSNIEFCAGPVATGDDPFNGLQFSNPNNTPVQAGLIIGVVKGSPLPGRIKVVYSGISLNQFATNSGTVQGHPGAKGANAVGAMYFRANPVCLPATYSQYALESYSSSGGTPLLFDVNGTRLTTPEIRQKPDFVAPDGGSTTFFLPGQLGARTAAIPQCTNPANGYNFFGTSAAAPHAAGVAALLLQAQPKATPDDLKRVLQSTALKNTSTITAGQGTPASPYQYANLPVPNFDVGYGFIQADAALATLLPTATVSVAAIDFGRKKLLSENASTVTVGNTGGSGLAISSIVVSGDDLSQTNNCPASLAPGATCSIVVTYRPDFVGSTQGSLTLNTNSRNGSVTTVALSGTGIVDPDGGGSFGALSLLLMAGAAVRRRVRRR